MIFDFTSSVNSSHIKKMMCAIEHRGPDANHFIEKTTRKGKLFLGSNRLKIIDKDDSSNQPLTSKNGRYALIFNGEIYNFEHLKNQLLLLGATFTSHSDTEVLLQWLIYKGKKEIGALNGMFSFVFADFQEQFLLIARDPLGIKPLFFFQSKNYLIISSEIKGIHASGLIYKKLNEKAINHYLAYKYPKRPMSFFENIEDFSPNNIWEVNFNGKTEKSILPTRKVNKKLDIGPLLIDAVIQQYSQSNNTGLMLSGGVDSTLLLAILNKELGLKNLPVFSIISYDKQGKSLTKDSAYASKAAKLYQASYNPISVDIHSLNALDTYIKTLDQPIADSGGFLTWLIAQEASEKRSKVLLSGAGADEFFAGYNRHIAFYYYLKFRHKKWFNFFFNKNFLPSNSPYFSQLKKFIYAINDNPSTTFNNFIQSDNFKLNGSLWDKELSNEAHFRKALSHDQQNYLSADVLSITDHSTMQYSVETRVPYLDSRVIDATRDLPMDYIFKNGAKWILKDLLINYGGKQFANRRKQGLGLPMADWLRTNKHWWEFNKNEAFIHSFLDAKQIDELLYKHINKKIDCTQELWRILLLHKWLKYNFT